MTKPWTAVALILLAASSGISCTAREEAPASTPEPVTAPAPAVAETAVEPSAPEPAPSVAPPPPTAAEAPVPRPPDPVPAPAAVPPTAAAAPAPPRPSGSDIVDPGGEVLVPAPRPGLTRVGVEKCKVCHKVQHASWASSAHARRTPPLDCEGCHGPGSEYKALAVMMDPKKARAAGLVDPDAAFCGRCHKKWDPALLGKAHAHKAAP